MYVSRKKDIEIYKFLGVVLRGFQKCGGPDPATFPSATPLHHGVYLNLFFNCYFHYRFQLKNQPRFEANQGPRIVWKLGWGVDNLVSKYAVRVKNSAQKYA